MSVSSDRRCGIDLTSSLMSTLSALVSFAFWSFYLFIYLLLCFALLFVLRFLWFRLHSRAKERNGAQLDQLCSISLGACLCVLQILCWWRSFLDDVSEGIMIQIFFFRPFPRLHDTLVGILHSLIHPDGQQWAPLRPSFWMPFPLAANPKSASSWGVFNLHCTRVYTFSLSFSFFSFVFFFWHYTHLLIEAFPPKTS